MKKRKENKQKLVESKNIDLLTQIKKLKSLNEGQEVEFKLVEGLKGLQAEEVTKR